eukprot:TRINITY_DN6974_c0_g1_i1.p1 TRINITY_DN6974_c0_g1~~TRINITY_DN6974_c0_g1_i1.p1  ORF type:complete len:404 (+),score=128.88 TRINITY_DN6974_c0_g1_i1:82-1293(+)
MDQPQLPAEEVLELDDVPPSAFSASSNALPPSFGRLHFPLSAWVAAGHHPQGEWLQINLGKAAPAAGDSYLVSAVATQGHPVEPWWVSAYSIELCRPDGDWVPYRSGQVLCGNADSHSVVEHCLSPPVHAAALRFVVRSAHGRAALRAGLRCTVTRGGGSAEAQAAEQLGRDLGMLVNADALADVAVLVKAGRAQRTLLAHRPVLCARSGYFARAIAVAEARMQRQQQQQRLVRVSVDNVIDAQSLGVGDDAACEMACEVVLAVLGFIYAARSPPREWLHPCARLAERLELPELRRLCDAQLLALARSPEGAVAAFAAADAEGRPDLKEAAVGTMLRHWEDLTVDWDALSKDQILQVVDAVERGRRAAAGCASFQHALSSPRRLPPASPPSTVRGMGYDGRRL